MKDTYGVRFTQKCRPYTAGDRAYFPPRQALRVVEELEAAEWIGEPPEKDLGDYPDRQARPGHDYSTK